MPLQPYTPNPLQCRVSDRYGFAQVARFLSLQHIQHQSGECQATIVVEVTTHELDAAGEPGAETTVFPRRPLTLRADNTTLVAADSGEILAELAGLNPQEQQQKIDSFPQATLRQGDFFELLRDHGLPGTIRQMLEQYIRQADAQGRFS